MEQYPGKFHARGSGGPLPVQSRAAGTLLAMISDNTRVVQPTQEAPLSLGVQSLYWGSVT